MATYKCKRPYMYGTGRRKHSVARVHLIPNGTGAITINGRDIDDYFGKHRSFSSFSGIINCSIAK